MNKKIIALLLIVGMLFSFISCKPTRQNDEESIHSIEQTEQQTEQVEQIEYCYPEVTIQIKYCYRK